jgi:hypothetical protein
VTYAGDKVVVLPLLESTVEMQESINECIEEQFSDPDSFELMAIVAPSNAEYVILSFSLVDEDD